MGGTVNFADWTFSWSIPMQLGRWPEDFEVNPPLPHPNPVGKLALSVFAERVDAERRQLQGSAGWLRLCLTTCPHGPPQLNARRRRRQTARIILQIQVTPGERPRSSVRAPVSRETTTYACIDVPSAAIRS
jgi:hypothetical protein